MPDSPDEAAIDAGDLHEAYLDAALSGDLVEPSEFMRRHGQSDEKLLEALQRVWRMAQAHPPCPRCGGAISVGDKACRHCGDAVGPTVLMEPTQRDPSSALLAQPDQGQIPQRFGPYQILREVARGGMGVVYSARHQDQQRIVALKILLPGLHRGMLSEQRFLLETRLISQLSHPNIVRLYDSGVIEDQRFFTMEYVEGTTLAGQLDQEPMTTRQKLEQLIQVARGVHHAHMRGIIHRDLKPSNILIDPDGVPKVADFGLAKQISEDSGESEPKLTLSGTTLGTPHYMSPEQASGASPQVDLRSDVFSLGVILYQALTERLPFDGDGLIEVLREVANCEVPPLGPNIPGELSLITLRAMAMEPKQRYQTAHELAEDLTAYLEGRPISARPASLWYRTRKWARRHPTLTVITATLCSALAVGSLWLSRQPGELVIRTGSESAMLTLNGEPIGKTASNQAFKLSLAPGQHKLKISKPGYFEVLRDIQLQPRQRREITERLRKTSGFLVINTAPQGAQVSISGPRSTLLPRTPGYVELPGGSYQLRIERPGYQTRTETVTIRSGGELTRVSKTLDRVPPAQLKITTHHRSLTLTILQKAQVIERIQLPLTGPPLPELAAGTYRLRFSQTGFLPREQTVTLDVGQQFRRLVNLSPIKELQQDLPFIIDHSIQVGDFDRSGTHDLLVLGKGTSPTTCLEYRAGQSRWLERWRTPSDYGDARRDGVLADLNRNGIKELLLLLHTGMEEHLLAISMLNGQTLWKRPIGRGDAQPAVGDLTGDGYPEIVLCNKSGQLFVLDGRTGRTKQPPIPIGKAPDEVRLVDLHGNGQLDALLSGRSGLLALDPISGDVRWKAVRQHHYHRVIVGDLDRRPGVEIIAASGQRIDFYTPSATRPTGQLQLKHQALDLALVPRHGAGPALIALTRDGWLLAFDGQTRDPLWRVRVAGSMPNTTHMALSDWDRDGVADITTAGQNGKVCVVSGKRGNIIWQHQLKRPLVGSPTLTDIDGDNLPEVYLATKSGRIIILAPRLDLAWWVGLDQGLGDLACDPTSKTIRYIDHQGGLHGMSLTDGQVRYTQKLHSGSFLTQTSEHLDEDSVADYWVASQSKLSARSGKTGKTIWSQQQPQRIQKMGARPADLDSDGVPDPVILMQAKAGQREILIARAHSGKHGRELWTTELGPAIDWSGAVHQNCRPVAAREGEQISILIPLPSGQLMSLDGKTGRIRWSQSGLKAKPPSTPLLVCSPTVTDLDADGVLDVVQPVGAYLFFYRLSDGRPPYPRMLSPYRSWYRGQPKIGRMGPGKGLVLADEKGVTVYRLPDRTLLWRHTTRDQPIFEGVTLADVNQDGTDDIFVGTIAGRMILLDGRNGKALWRFQSGGALVFPPLAVRGADHPPDKRSGPPPWLALCASSDGKLHAVRIALRTVSHDWPSPDPSVGGRRDYQTLMPRLERERALQRLNRALTPTESPTYSGISNTLAEYRAKVGEDAWYRYGQACQRRLTSGGRAAALAAVEAALKLRPQLYHARLLRAELLADAKRTDEALEDLEPLRTTGTSTWRTHQLRGRLLLGKGLPAQAVHDLSEAVRLEPTSRSSRLLRARALISLKRWGHAKADLDLLISSYRSTPREWFLRGRMWELQQEWNRALDDYREALSSFRATAQGQGITLEKPIKTIQQAIERVEKKRGQR